MRGVYDYTIYRATRVGRRVLALIVALFIIILFSGDRVVAETKTETENAIRLIGGTGTVNVIDYNGKISKATSKMRLSNGSTIATASGSSAYVNLDSTKSVKLDALTKAEVRKSGGRYEVLLNSGNLFFNVTAPLATSEIFNVRTSNMTMSIRGTCAQVEVIDARHTRVCLLEGSLHCKLTSLKSGESKTVILLAGQAADFYLNGTTENDCKIVTEDIGNDAIRGFVLQELMKDKSLANKIFQQSGLDFRNLTQASVDEKLKSEKKKSNTSEAKKKDDSKKAMQKTFLEQHSEGKLLYTTEGNVVIVPDIISVEEARFYNIQYDPYRNWYNQSSYGQNNTNYTNSSQSHNRNNNHSHSRKKEDDKKEEYKSGSMKDAKNEDVYVKIEIPSPKAAVVVRNYFDGE